jgi:hypothetical protein
VRVHQRHDLARFDKPRGPRPSGVAEA